MPLSNAIKETISSSSLIRKVFEEGTMLKKQYGADKVFDFSLGNPDLAPPPEFKKALLKLVNEDTSGVHGYMNNAGFPQVREVLAQKTSKEHAVNINGSHIVMSCGAAGGLNVVFRCIFNPGDEIIIPKPYFGDYNAYISNYGGLIVGVDSLPDFNLDVQAIGSKLSPKTAAVMINSPHNPTGRIYSAETIKKLAQVMLEHGKKCGRMPYLISDEPYRDIAYDGAEVSPVLCHYPESIVVNSYSKSLSLPGERIGYIAMGPEIEDKGNLLGAFTFATRILGFVNAPALMQRIVAELVDARVDVGIYAARRAAFMKIMDETGIAYSKPEGAFYLFCKAPGGNDIAFSDHLKKYLVLGVPGTGFKAPGWIRFAYCVDEKIIKASGPAFKKAIDEWSK